VELDAAEFEEAVEGRYLIPNNFSAALVQLTASGYSQMTPIAPVNPVTYAGKTKDIDS
jgi:hypothetical protein